MLKIDIVNLVLGGTLPPFNSSFTRQGISELLGETDEPHCPDHALYGNVCFDLVNGVGPLSAISISFPHDDHRVRTHKNVPLPPWLNQWPDGRFDWDLGPFKPGLNTETLMAFSSEFEPLETHPYNMKAWGHGHIACMPKSNVQLFFDATREEDDRTLSLILAVLPRQDAR